MGLLPLVAVLSFQSRGALRVARTMDLRVDDPWMEPDLTKNLGPQDAPEMVRLLSVVRRDITFRTLAGALRRLKWRKAIPVLVENLDRPLQAGQNRAAFHALEAWSWEAIPALRKGLRSPRRWVGLDCARLLVGQCQQQRALKSPPLRPVMLRLAHSNGVAMREIALDGLWRLGGAVHDWAMDGVHRFEAVCDRPSMAGVVDLALTAIRLCGDLRWGGSPLCWASPRTRASSTCSSRPTARRSSSAFQSY